MRTHGALTDYSLSRHGSLTSGREGKGREGKFYPRPSAYLTVSRARKPLGFGASQ